MLLLILILVSGSLLVYLSQSNLTPVALQFGPYVFPNIPLFYVIVGSLVIGLGLSYIFYLVHAISNSLAMRSKDTVIKKNRNTVAELTKRVHQLELENEKLKRKSSGTPVDPNAL